MLNIYACFPKLEKCAIHATQQEIVDDLIEKYYLNAYYA